jgi:hypothetical protein
MGKQRKKHGAIRSGRDESLDKPDYAADTILEKKKEKKPAVRETDIFVEEQLNQKTLQSLSRMKEQLLADANKPAGKQTGLKKKVAGKSASEKIAEDPNVSFADLFDPADDDEHSFEDMLKDSKMDWRKFKD